MSATLLIVIVVWFCRSEKMTMSNIVVHCCYGVVLQAPKNVVVYCYWGAVLQEQKKNKKKQCNYSLSFWCGRASAKK